MNLYKWVCQTGCGHVTYTEKEWKIRPYCSSCGSRSRMKPDGIFEATLEKHSTLFNQTKEKIKHG